MKKKEQRKPTFAEALLPLIAMLLILTVGYGVFGFPKEAMLVMSAAVTAIVAFHLGVSWDDMINGVSEKIAKAMPTIPVSYTHLKQSYKRAQRLSLHYFSRRPELLRLFYYTFVRIAISQSFVHIFKKS